MVNPIQTDVDN